MYNDCRKFFASLFAAVLLCGIADSQAQEAPQVPPKPGAPGTLMEGGAPFMAGETLTPKPTTPAQEENRFDVFEYRVTGNTVLPRGTIEEAVYPWMGESKTITDVDKAREGLEKAYHKAGYLTVLVDIPEQDVNQGVVQLNVTEGKVDRLRVKGSRYYSLGFIKEQAPSLAEGQVPYFPDVQTEMASLNRTADRQVTPVMKAGKKFGTVEVDLKVKDNLPLHASLELNDQYSRNTERWRLSGMIRYDNLWQRDHSLTLQFQTAPQNTSQVKVLSASYLYRFNDSDKLLALYGVKSDSSVATVNELTVRGNGNIFGARLIFPFPSSATYSHSLSLGVDYKNFHEDIQTGSQTTSTTSPIKYMPLAIQYSGTLQSEKGVTQLGLGVNFGLRGIVGTDEQFNSKEPGARSNFFVLKPEVQRTQVMPMDFQLWGKLDGQFTGSKLISNEQYSAGGANSVRGYLEAESAGDNALHATLELRSPPLHRGDWLQELRFIGFYDIATLNVIDASAVQREQRTIAGTGLGLTLKAQHNWNASIAVARALHDAAMTSSDTTSTRSGRVAGHMRFWYEF